MRRTLNILMRTGEAKAFGKERGGHQSGGKEIFPESWETAHERSRGTFQINVLADKKGM